MTTTHEFSSPLWVKTPHGDGRALVLFDYGIDHNPVFMVQLNDGRFLCYDMTQIRGCENMTLGIECKQMSPPEGFERVEFQIIPKPNPVQNPPLT